MRLTLTQTTIKLINSEDCPRKWNSIYIEKTAERIVKPVFTKGQYFEQLAIGSSAGDTEKVEIPLLKNGSIPAEYKRIIKQAILAKHYVFPKYGLEIENTQLFLQKEYKIIEGVEVTLEGTLDIKGKIYDPEISKEKKTDCIVDLKLTGDLNSSFGSFSWAFPMTIDHTQVFMYDYLYRAVISPEGAPFYYMVFDYKANKPEYKVFKKSVDDMDRAELTESIRSATVKYKQMHEMGFPENSSYENCKHCTLKDVCKSYTDVKPIKY